MSGCPELISVQFECELLKTVEIGDGSNGSTTVVFGRIVLVHIDKGAYVSGRVDPDHLKPIARMGGIGYAKLGEIFNLPVPAPITE